MQDIDARIKELTVVVRRARMRAEYCKRHGKQDCGRHSHRAANRAAVELRELKKQLAIAMAGAVFEQSFVRKPN